MSDETSEVARVADDLERPIQLCAFGGVPTTKPMQPIDASVAMKAAELLRTQAATITSLRAELERLRGVVAELCDALDAHRLYMLSDDDLDTESERELGRRVTRARNRARAALGKE